MARTENQKRRLLCLLDLLLHETDADHPMPLAEIGTFVRLPLRVS